MYSRKPVTSVVPDAFTMTVGRLLADPGAGEAAISAAEARSERLHLSGPLRLGADPGHDVAALRLLSAAATRLVPLDWTLAGVPPWPVRTLVHLPPPADGTGPAARKYAALWRGNHRYGLCTYRRGPGFIRIRDVRPEGPHLRILIDGTWAEVFHSLTAVPSDAPAGHSGAAAGPSDAVAGPAGKLLDELSAAGLTVDLGGVRNILPVRLRRWPIPYTDV